MIYYDGHLVRKTHEGLGLKGFWVILLGNRLEPQVLAETVAWLGVALLAVSWVCWFLEG